MFGIHTTFSSLFQNKCKVNENVRSHLSFHSIGEPVGKTHDPKVLFLFFFTLQYSDILGRWTSHFKHKFLRVTLFYSPDMKVYGIRFIFV